MSIVLNDVLYVSSIQGCNHIAKQTDRDSYNINFKYKKFYARTYVKALKVLKGLVRDVKSISSLVTTVTKTKVLDEISFGVFLLADGRLVDKESFHPNCAIEGYGISMFFREGSSNSSLGSFYFRKYGEHYSKGELLREFSYTFLTEDSRVSGDLRNFVLSLPHLEIDGIDYYESKKIAELVGVSAPALNGRLRNGESVESAIRSLKSKDLPILSYKGMDFYSVKEVASFLGKEYLVVIKQIKVVKALNCPVDILFENLDFRFIPYQDYTGKWWRNVSLFLKSVGLSYNTYKRREKICKKLGAPLSLIVADCYNGFYPIRDYKGNWFVNKDALAKHYGLKSKQQLEYGDGLKLLYPNT